MAKNLLLMLAVVVVCDVLFAQVLKRALPTPLRVQRVMERGYRIESPIYHHDLAKNTAQRGAWGDRVYPIFTNSLGFKDRQVREVPLTSEDWRILFIGDSFTEGTGVRYEDTFVGILDDVLGEHHVRVLNAGVASYSPSIYYRKVKYLIDEVGLDFDELVVFLDISDIDDEANCYDLDAHDQVITATAAAPFREPEISLTSKLKENSVLIRLVDLAKDMALEGDGWRRVVADERAQMRQMSDTDRAAWTFDPARLDAYGRRGLARAMDRMDRLWAVLRAHDKPLTVVVYPWPAQLLAGDRDSIQTQVWRQWCERNGVQFINLFPEFFDAGAPMDVLQANYIPWDNHFNERGNAVVAKAFREHFVSARDRASRTVP